MRRLHLYCFILLLGVTNHLNAREVFSQPAYNQMNSTCSSWTKRYNKDRSEGSRVHMNSACKYAADYLKRTTGITKKSVNHVEYYENQKLKKRKTYTKKTTNTKSYNCVSWKKQRENIQNQLRAGYKEPRGNYLRGRKRELSDLIAKHC